MGKRERDRALKQLESERAARQAPRDAVYRQLWEDPKYKRLHDRKTVLFQALRWAKPADVAAAERRYAACLKRICAYENAALAAAGLTP